MTPWPFLPTQRTSTVRHPIHIDCFQVGFVLKVRFINHLSYAHGDTFIRKRDSDAENPQGTSSSARKVEVVFHAFLESGDLYQGLWKIIWTISYCLAVEAAPIIPQNTMSPHEHVDSLADDDLLRNIVQGCTDCFALLFHRDRKSTRLNSSHGYISYAVFCLKKKKKKISNFFFTKKTKNRKTKCNV